LLQRTLGLGEACVIEISHAGQTIGDFILLMPANQTIHNPQIVQIYAELVGLVLMRSRSEQALQASEERLDLFFTQSLDGFFFMMLGEPVRWDDTVDKEAVLAYVFDHQHLTKVNRAMFEQYGLTETEMLGMTPRDFFAHNLALGRRVWRKLFDRGQMHIDTDERRADGSQMWVEGDYICLYDQEGRITGHFGIQRDVTTRVQAEEEREKLIDELQSALAEIKTLRGIIPICASCKKIRDDEGYWHDVAVYIRDHSEAEFSHGICPDCAKKLYPDFFKDDQ
jgi:PAS domain S-box-containing protein